MSRTYTELAGYDPARHITAERIRKMGSAVPAEIPDCAFVERSSFSFGVKDTPSETENESGIVSVDVSLDFNASFRWVEFKFILMKEGEGMTREELIAALEDLECYEGSSVVLEWGDGVYVDIRSVHMETALSTIHSVEDSVVPDCSVVPVIVLSKEMAEDAEDGPRAPGAPRETMGKVHVVGGETAGNTPTSQEIYQQIEDGILKACNKRVFE